MSTTKDITSRIFLPGAGDLYSKIKFIADEVVDYENPVATTSGTYYITDILEDGTYYFAVRSVDDAGNISDVAYKKLVVEGAPQPVSQLNYSFLPGPKIYLYWQPSPAGDVASYNIYSNNGSGEINYSTIYDSVSGTSWTSDILSNGAWKFNVRCMDDQGLEETNFHNEIYVNIDETVGYPEPPSNLRAYAVSGGRIKLIWDASPSSDVRQYNIYYDNGTSVIDYANKLASVNHSDYFFGILSFTYTSPALSHAVTYKFGIRAENWAGVEEKNTTVVASATADTLAPPKPTLEASGMMGGR